MKTINIEERKIIQLDILQVVHDFCVEHSINYSLACGSLLGAVRHKGYIPWDDDIDIYLLRADYIRLINEFPETINNVSLFSLERDKKWAKAYAQACDNRTLGFGIDVYPIDSVPQDELSWKRYNGKRRFFQHVYSMKVVGFRRGRSIYKNIFVLMTKILLLPFSERRIAELLNRLSLQNHCIESDYVFECCQGMMQQRPFKKTCMEKTVDILFEGRFFKAMYDYDGYLTNAYGNYMQLPPIEKRVSHHEFEAYWQKSEAPTILQINVDANNGSNGSIACDIGTLVLKEGWESYIAYGRKVIPCDSELIRIGSRFDIITHGLITRLFDLHGLGSVLATWIFIRKVKKIKPDIVHLHNIHGYFINYKILFKYLIESNMPVIWTLHDAWSFTGHCAFVEIDHDCHRWKNECYDCPMKKAYPTSFLCDKSRTSFELKKKLFTSVKNMTLVPVAYWLGEIMQDSFFYGKNIVPIHNGVNINIFKPSEISRSTLNLSDKQIVLGVSNAWSNGKGLKEFIKLSKDFDGQIIMIGVNDSLKKLLPPNIITISRTENQKQLADYYSVADVFVTPSYGDTLSTVCIEALACGTPVITYKTAGNPEVVDAETGIVVPLGDYDSLLDSIRKILDEPVEKRNARSKLCRLRAEKYFDKSRQFEEYIALYKSILRK